MIFMMSEKTSASQDSYRLNVWTGRRPGGGWRKCGRPVPGDTSARGGAARRCHWLPPARGRHRPVVKCPHGHARTHSPGHPNTSSHLDPSPAPEETPACATPQAAGTTTDMRVPAFLVLLLWAAARAHPVPGHEPARLGPSAQQQDTASEDYINKLGNLLGGGDGRYPPASVERGDNALVEDPAGGNAVGEELGEHGGQEKGGRVGEAQDLNWVDHEDASARDGNSLGFLEEDARDADDGGNGEHHGAGVSGLPSHAGGLLDEEDDSGDDTFDENGEEEGGEGPTYVAGADEHDHDAGRGDARGGGGHSDSSSSSSSESTGVDHRRYRNYLGSRYERTYRQGGGSSSSQEEEESYDFEDEGMQGDDPSVFDGLGSSYKGHRAGPRSLGSSRESSWGAGSHRWEKGDSRSPEVEDTDSGEDSPSTEDNSQSEEPATSQSEEKSASRSSEDGDGEDSPSREGEDSESREGTTDQSDEEAGESPEDVSREVVSTSSERSGSRSQEGQEDWESAQDRSAPSVPDSESGEDEGNQSKSGEDDGEQSQSTEDTAEESKEDEDDSNPDGDVPSASAESQSASVEDGDSQEDNTGEESRSTESNNSESQEDDDDEESHSQEDATRESSSRGDDSSPQSLESGSRKRRPGAYRNKPAADYDDNDCQDGY
ncbi:dentin matrix acidic phosphoprotein 1-like [Tyto alba]|uniref:dentin matrix acidic phosphoprotein 1-like n=1 Tax=Tyto alba TaxID=56313 RepID=UPI001C677C11|nr:dentin matrix acidic phosphoprotein 1-like [Tyto alba]